MGPPMRSTRYSEAVILCLLKEAASGTSIGEVCSTARISTRTFYRWRAQYGSLTPSAARERNQLLHENRRLRRLVSDLRRPRRDCACETAGLGAVPVRAECGAPSASPRTRPVSSSGRFAGLRGQR